MREMLCVDLRCSTEGCMGHSKVYKCILEIAAKACETVKGEPTPVWAKLQTPIPRGHHCNLKPVAKVACKTAVTVGMILEIRYNTFKDNKIQGCRQKHWLLYVPCTA